MKWYVYFTPWQSLQNGKNMAQELLVGVSMVMTEEMEWPLSELYEACSNAPATSAWHTSLTSVGLAALG